MESKDPLTHTLKCYNESSWFPKLSTRFAFFSRFLHIPFFQLGHITMNSRQELTTASLSLFQNQELKNIMLVQDKNLGPVHQSIAMK